MRGILGLIQMFVSGFRAALRVAIPPPGPIPRAPRRGSPSYHRRRRARRAAMRSAGRANRSMARANAWLTAIQAFIAAVGAASQAVMTFVGALNPFLVFQLDRVFANLMATIGHAFEPAVAQAVAVVQDFTGTLAPLMRELRPVVAELATAIGTILSAVVYVLVAVLKVLLGAFKWMFAGLSILGSIVGQVVEVLGVLYEWLASFVQSIGDALGITEAIVAIYDALKTVIFSIVQAFTFLLVSVYRLLNLFDSIAKMKASIERRIAEKKGAGGFTAAPKDVGTGGIEDIARKMAERAFVATSGGVAKSETELLESILESIKAAESKDLYKIIRDAVKEGVKDGLPRVLGGKPEGDGGGDPAGGGPEKGFWGGVKDGAVEVGDIGLGIIDPFGIMPRFGKK